jgi:tetratricopeptide (TPR) repeat protein
MDMSLRPLCEKHRVLLISAALVVLTSAAYETLRRNDFVKFDDPEYITENLRLQSGITMDSVTWALKSGEAANWHPLTWISHMLDVRLFGLNAVGHHLHSLSLHILSTLLLFWLLRSMTGAVWRSAFVAMAFGIHPVHVESVAWAAERKDVLCGVFWMLTIAAYVSYARRGGIFRYTLVLLCFALGLMAKPMIVTLPIVLLVLDFWPIGRLSFAANHKATPDAGRPASLFRLVLEKSPLFLLTLASCVITFLVQKNGGAVAGFDVTLLDRLANTFVSYGRYIGKMALPTKLAVIYPLPPEGWPMWKPLLSAVILIAISIFVLRSARKRPYLLVGWIWYFVTLVPVIGLVQVGSQAMADRYTYLPSIGIFIMVAWGVAELAAKWPHREPVLGVLSGLVCILMIVGTRMQVSHWQNGATLYAHALAVTENNYALHSCLGTVLEGEGKLDEAEHEYRETIRMCPTFVDAYLCLGQISELRGKYSDAIQSYQQAGQINPADFRPVFKVGEAKAKQGLLDEAINCYRRTIQMSPGFAKAHIALGQAFAVQGKYEDAMQSYSEAMRLDPTDPKLYYRIGAVKAQQGSYPQAEEYFRRSIQMNAGLMEAYVGLGVVLQKQNRTDEAIAQFRTALKIKPNDSELWSNLGDCLQGQGKLQDALDAYNQSLKLKPDEASTYCKLGEVAKQQGQVKLAVAQQRKALEIKSDFVPSLNNLAWILATSKDSEIRNPSEAVQFAQKACEATSSKDQNCLDTLAAAYASAGQFDKAAETAQKAIDLAQAAKDNDSVQDISKKLKLYQAKQPYLEP